VKIGKNLNRLIFGTADGPRVRGGRSAGHESCSLEALQLILGRRSFEADGPRARGGPSAGHEN
jgi:hypothetical protein